MHTSSVAPPEEPKEEEPEEGKEKEEEEKQNEEDGVSREETQVYLLFFLCINFNYGDPFWGNAVPTAVGWKVV